MQRAFGLPRCRPGLAVRARSAAARRLDSFSGITSAVTCDRAIRTMAALNRPSVKILEFSPQHSATD